MSRNLRVGCRREDWNEGGCGLRDALEVREATDEVGLPMRKVMFIVGEHARKDEEIHDEFDKLNTRRF